MTLYDLLPGNVLHVLGLQIHITQADVYSRRFLRERMNIMLPADLEIPELARTDAGTHLALGMGGKLFPPKKDNKFPPTYVTCGSCLGEYCFVIFVGIFYIEWCIRDPLSSCITLCNCISIVHSHHTNNNPSLHLSGQPYPKSYIYTGTSSSSARSRSTRRSDTYSMIRAL